MARSFRYGREIGPPEDVTLYYQRQVTEKTEVAGEGGAPAFEERPVEPEQWVDEEITVHVRRQGGSGLLLKAADVTNPKQTAAIRQALRTGIVEAERLLDLLDDPYTTLGIDTIADLVQTMTELSSGRPTTAPSR